MRTLTRITALAAVLCLAAAARPEGLAEVEEELISVAERASRSVVAVTVLPDPRPGLGPVRMSCSGILWDGEGHVVTPLEAVAGGGRIEVTLPDGRKVEARCVGQDPVSNIALLRAAAEGVQAARFGDSLRLRPGAFAIVAGNAFGMPRTISLGVVSGLDRTVDVGGHVYQKMIQFTAAVNPGDMGGALVNSRGEVIGMVSACFARAPSASHVRSLSGWPEVRGAPPAPSVLASEGLAFATPVHVLEPLIQELKTCGEVRRGWLGIVCAPVSPPEPAAGAREGALVLEVVAGSPAESCGLRPGDVIVACEERPVRAPADLMERVRARTVGHKVSLKVLRDGRADKVEATLARCVVPCTRPDDLTALVRQALGAPWIGVVPLEPARAGPGPGVELDQVVPGSPAAASGLRRGDVILAIDESGIATVQALREHVGRRSVHDEIRVRVMREGSERLVRVRIGACPLPAWERAAPRTGTEQQMIGALEREIEDIRQRARAAKTDEEREDLNAILRAKADQLDRAKRRQQEGAI